MQTKTFATAALLEAATAALTPAQLDMLHAVPADGGGYSIDLPDDLAELIGAPWPLDMLAANLVAAATSTCAALTLQVVPDEVHGNAYRNAFTIVGPNATVPTVEPTKSAFAAMASAAGVDAPTFATMVVSIAAVSCQLQAAQATVARVAASAKSITELKAALANFDAAIGAIVGTIKAAGVTVTAPDAITITGLNA